MSRARPVLIVWALIVASCSGAPATETSTATSNAVATTTTTTQGTTTSSSTTTSISITTQPTTTTTVAVPVVPTFVIFMPRGLSDDFVERVRPIDGLTAIALIHTETLHIVETTTARGSVIDRPRDGYVIPVQGAAVVASDHESFLTPDVAELLASLDDDQVLLSASSAELRGIGVGGTISFDSGRTVDVLGIVNDAEFGAEELITTDATLVGGAGSELRFAVVQYSESADTLRSAIQDALPEGAGFGVHPRGRAADQTTAVRSQVWIKQTFGEFAYRPTGSGTFTIDPDWIDANIVVADVPILGSVRCHQRYIELLTEVMTSLVTSGNEDAIDRGAFLGCWNSRYVANSRRLSRHAWGAAADINFFNPLDGGAGSPVNAALLEAMAALGITSGHDWSIPDPGHFEYYGFPQDE